MICMEPGSGDFFVHSEEKENRELVYGLFSVICESEMGESDTEDKESLMVSFESMFGEAQVAAITKTVCDILEKQNLSGIHFTVDADMELDWENYEQIRIEQGGKGLLVQTAFYHAEHDPDYFDDEDKREENFEQWVEKVDEARNSSYAELLKSRPIPFEKFCREAETETYKIRMTDSDWEKITHIIRDYQTGAN